MRIDIVVSDGGIDEVVGTVRIVPNDAPDTGDALAAIRGAMCELADLTVCLACGILYKPSVYATPHARLCRDCDCNPDDEAAADEAKAGDQAFDRQREERTWNTNCRKGTHGISTPTSEGVNGPHRGES